MKAFRTAAIGVAFAAAGILVATPPTSVYASGGPVILDGTDSGYHGQVNSSGIISGQWIYTQKAYENLVNGVSQTYANSSNGRIAVIGASSLSTSSKPASNNCGAAAYWAAQNMASPVPVDFYDGATAINSFFDGVQAGTTKPLLIHIVDGICNANGMGGTELTTVNGRANDIAIHVNRGGALLSNTGAHIDGGENYGWLTTLFPDLTATQSGCSGSSLSLTDAGFSAFPSLTNSDMAGAWHNCFVSSSSPFPLDVLASQNGHAVIIGGAAVTLPSTVSATASSVSLEVGQEVCLTATVEVGNPLAPFSGALVAFTISGANTDITLSNETTDTEGNTPNSCFTGTATGTDTVTITATNPDTNDSLGEATVTIEWSPPSATIPGAPASIAADPGDGEAVITWTAPTDDGGSVITSYTVTSSPGDIDCTWTSGPLSCTVTGLTNGTEYTFFVTATNAFGTSDPSSTESGTPLSPPGVPRSLSVETGIDTITLVWDVPATTGGSDITDYVIEYSVDGSNWLVLEDGVSTATTTTVTGLNNNVDHIFRVAAVNAIGTGPSTQLDTGMMELVLPSTGASSRALPFAISGLALGAYFALLTSARRRVLRHHDN